MNVANRRLSGFVFPHWLTVTSIYFLCAVLTGSLLVRELGQIDKHVAEIARERGSVLFRLIELTRDWSALHGGVYVPVTEHTQPNPYLLDPKRDVVTQDGTRLTKINPAFMTRQLAELAEPSNGVRFHITSLNPIRPDNRADAWEAVALASFDNGVKERIEFINDAQYPVHRFMAPLLVKPGCLKCHQQQGYKLGDVRGGISVTMPAQELLRVRNEQRMRAWILYGVAFVLVAGLLHYLVLRSRRYIAAVREINAQQESLIAERTRDLARVNDGLALEVAERRQNEVQLRKSEDRYRAVVDFSTDGVLISEGWQLVFANARLGEILGCAAADLIGVGGLDIIHPDDREIIRERHEKRERGETVSDHYRVRLQHKNPHHYVVADLSLKILETDPGGPLRLLGIVRDVTAELVAERESEIAAAVFENAAEAIMVTDAGNQIVRVNPAFTAITGYTPNDVVGRDPKVLRSGRHDAAYFHQLWMQLQKTGRWQGEIWNRRKNGEPFVEWLSITRVIRGVGEGNFVATFTDITARKEADELIRHKATYDGLTNLPNRSLYRDRLHSTLVAANRYQRRFALMYVDLDHFKAINDTLGHAAGDALLIEAARRMVACVRDSDTVARLGGDEFAILLPEIHDVLEVEEAAQRVLTALERPFELSEGGGQVSGSIGIAIYPDHGHESDVLERHSDTALYVAKEAGRNCYRVYSPLMTRI
jgi:diguanylate cyclase (GGDEF)-like protein/PAS domain S-box-containing protein